MNPQQLLWILSQAHHNQANGVFLSLPVGTQSLCRSTGLFSLESDLGVVFFGEEDLVFIDLE